MAWGKAVLCVAVSLSTGVCYLSPSGEGLLFHSWPAWPSREPIKWLLLGKVVGCSRAGVVCFVTRCIVFFAEVSAVFSSWEAHTHTEGATTHLDLQIVLDLLPAGNAGTLESESY